MPTSVSKVLVANRGEIAVRVIRACRDAGLECVAVYADPDRDSPFVRMADEAIALGGSSAAETYLAAGKLVDAAQRSGADSVHPGYGFLSENAEFAQAVIDAGLVWVGPGPRALAALGDKVAARRIAARAGAPLVPGTDGPVTGPAEVIAFAREHGLPVAIKAAFGGGGRGLRVACTTGEIPELLQSAVREAQAAFGRGECLAERYLARPRHVEAQVLADAHGTVVVLGTRDCSLQRRHQKLVEEAPAPFLSAEQRRVIHESARAICREAGYQGAGTVEYLVGEDGSVSFLEVNARLQVEHPVTEETAGVDLVREQLRIAAGQRLHLTEDPPPRGHAIEFRINAEDASRNFLPSQGAVTRFAAPGGPGVRTDSGVDTGSATTGNFDSLLAKLIVTGQDRQHALERARRVLDEMVVEGVATLLPFHRAVVRHPDFAGDGHGFGVHTQWVEEGFTGSVPAFGDSGSSRGTAGGHVAVVEVGGRWLRVALPGAAGLARGGPAVTANGAGVAAAGDDAVTAPMQGTAARVTITDGMEVAAGDLLVVVEAMKMENPVVAHKAGTVTGVRVAAGQPVTHGMVLCEIRP